MFHNYKSLCCDQESRIKGLQHGNCIAFVGAMKQEAIEKEYSIT